MYSLTIPFSNESIETIELVDGEREEVEQQLDQRRIAMQEIRTLGRSAEDGEIIIDAENDKVIVDNGSPTALEANDTLKILVKSVLHNVKDIGVANENIVAMVISNSDKHCLLTEYHKFYTSEEFNHIVSALVEIGNKVFQDGTDNTPISNVISLQKLSELANNNYTTSEVDYDATHYLVDTTISEYLKGFTEIKDNLADMCFNLAKLDGHVTVENSDSESTPVNHFKSWEETTITSLENKEVNSAIRLVLELNKYFTTSIAKVYEVLTSEIANFGDEEVNELMDSVRSQYNLLCANAEFKLLSERTQAIESYTNSLMAIEAFRDSKIGRILNFVYQFLKRLVSLMITNTAFLIKDIVDAIVKLVAGINSLILSMMAREKTKKLNNSKDVEIYFNNDLTDPKFFVKYKDLVKGYDVSIKGVASGVSANDASTIPSGARRIKITSLDELTETFKQGSEENQLTVKGFTVPINKIKEVMLFQCSLHDYIRDVVVDFLKDGKEDTIIVYLDHLKTVLRNIAVTINFPGRDKRPEIDFSTLVFHSGKPDYQDIIERCHDLRLTLNGLNNITTVVDSLESIVSGWDRNPNTLQKLSLVFGINAKKIEKQTNSLDSIFDRVTEDDDSTNRAVVAREYIRLVCDVSKLVSTAINNSIQAACKLERFKSYSSLIRAKLVNRIYKDTIGKED